MSHPKYIAYTYQPLSPGLAIPLSPMTKTAGPTPQLHGSLLMPSIDLMSPVSPRVQSRYATPLANDHRDAIYDSPIDNYTPTAGTRGFTPRRTCSPYGSPSNPFRYHTGASHSQSPMSGFIASRAPVDLHGAIQRITATGVSTWTASRTRSRESDEWGEQPVRAQFVESMVQVLFWAAVVVLFSALLGTGEKARPAELITTRAWSRHVPGPSGLAGMGWKGVGMVDQTDGLAPAGIGKGILSIWDDEVDG